MREDLGPTDARVPDVIEPVRIAGSNIVRVGQGTTQRAVGPQLQRRQNYRPRFINVGDGLLLHPSVSDFHDPVSSEASTVTEYEGEGEFSIVRP